MNRRAGFCQRCFTLLPDAQGQCPVCAEEALPAARAPSTAPVLRSLPAQQTEPASATPELQSIRTSHYGKAEDVYLPQDDSSSLDESEPSDRVEGALHLGMLWIRRLLVISAVTALFTVGILSLAKRNRAAQAEAFVRAQIGLKQQERTAQLLEAHGHLSDLFSELKLKGRENPNTESHRRWRAGWRERLQQVVLEYRLDGQVDFTRTHTLAEAALRDVQLYLFSLEREWRGAVDEASPISRQLEQSLKDARNDLN